MASRSSVLMHNEFLDRLSGMPHDIKLKALKAIKMLTVDFRHPGLQTKKVKSAKLDIYECRVDNDYRLIYDFVVDVIRCWFIGTHDVALKFAEAVKVPPVNYAIEDIEPIDLDAGLFDLVVCLNSGVSDNLVDINVDTMIFNMGNEPK